MWTTLLPHNGAKRPYLSTKISRVEGGGDNKSTQKRANELKTNVLARNQLSIDTKEGPYKTGSEGDGLQPTQRRAQVRAFSPTMGKKGSPHISQVDESECDKGEVSTNPHPQHECMIGNQKRDGGVSTDLHKNKKKSYQNKRTHTLKH